MNSNFFNTNQVLSSLVVFTFVYVGFILLSIFTHGFHTGIASLVWMASFVVPELLATFYSVKKYKRLMSRKERKLTSLLSALVRTVYIMINASLIFWTDKAIVDFSVISYLLTVLAGAIVILWLIEYFIYYVSEKISTTIINSSQL